MHVTLLTPSKKRKRRFRKWRFSLCSFTLKLLYHKRRQTDLECQPLEELSEDQRDLNPQFEDELSMTTDATSKYAIIIIFLLYMFLLAIKSRIFAMFTNFQGQQKLPDAPRVILL